MSAPTPPSYSERLDTFPAVGQSPVALNTIAGDFGAWVLVAADTGPAPLLVCAMLAQSAAAIDGVLVQFGAGNPAQPLHSIRFGAIPAGAVTVLPLTIAALIPPNTRLSMRAAAAAAGVVRVGSNYAT